MILEVINLKIKKPIIHRLNENDLEVVESYYQCLFNKTPLDIFEIKNNTIDECKFEKIDFSKINLTYCRSFGRTVRFDWRNPNC